MNNNVIGCCISNDYCMWHNETYTVVNNCGQCPKCKAERESRTYTANARKTIDKLTDYSKFTPI